MLTQFHEKAQKVIVIAESIAFDLGHSHVGSEHLLLSLLKLKDQQFVKTLNEYDVTDGKIYDDIVRLFGEKDIQPFYMEYSDTVKKILEDAIMIAKEKKQTKVMINDLMLALIRQEKSVARELLNKYHVSLEELEKQLSEERSPLYELDQIHELVNLNQKVIKEKRLMIGREKELNQLCSILCKKEKNNALLIGKAGVGKTALIEKLAYLINEKKVPKFLEKKVIYELNLSSLVAGTKYRGEFEEKFKRMIDKIMNANDAIIFIDEIHNLIGAGGAEGAIDASNILKPFIARKQLTLIGATTLDEYYKYFEKDQAMNRRFSLIKMKENTEEETLSILKGLKEQYELYHHIKIKESLLEDIICFSKKYLTNRVFPDKALDVLDLGCVKARFNDKKVLTLDDIKHVIEDMSGLILEENISYEQLEKQLKEDIIGQDKVIKQFVSSLKRNKYSQKEGVYLFVGNSGVGKNLFVNKLSMFLKRPLISLNMAEYSESSSITKIIGTSPGYIGYDQQSSILKELLLNPHSLLLLDEVEKAHPKVLDLFIKSFKDGFIKDNQNRLISLSHTIIIMTTHKQEENKSVGFKKQINQMDLNEYFSKDFINSLDDILIFNDLNKNDLRKIGLKLKLDLSIIEDILKNYDVHLGARVFIKRIGMCERT